MNCTIQSPEESFRQYEEFPTDALLFLHQRDNMLTEELDLAFSVWKQYPERIVGHLARSHLWVGEKKSYQYSYNISTQYSMVLLDTAVIHRYYLFKMMEYHNHWKDSMFSVQCYDILLNIIVSEISKHPPVKVGERLTYTKSYASKEEQDKQLAARSSCLSTYYSNFDSVSLRYSQVRLSVVSANKNTAKDHAE